MQLEQHIREENLMPLDAKLLVGVSGGADSSVLLHVLWRMGYEVVVAHCNFHLRGEASDGDAAFVRTLAHNYGFKFYEIDFKTEEIASQRGISIEMAARELRYEWFEKLLEKEECQFIAVGHHADDAVETFFLNLLRGSGLKGLSGMRRMRDHVVRPLLGVNRTDVLQYCKEHGLDYREDVTNQETIYRRNKLRLEVIPLLQEMNPSLTHTILETTQRMSDAYGLVQWASEKIKQEVCCQVDDMLCFDLKQLLNFPGHGTLLYEWLGDYGFTQSQIADMLLCDNKSSGQGFYSEAYVISHSRGTLFLKSRSFVIDSDEFKIPNEVGTYGTQIKIKLEYNSNEIDYRQNKNKSKIYLNPDSLEFPLRVRRWRKGDFFYPLGMTGKKKLSDYFTDLKLSPLEKKQVYILESNGSVVWVIGYRQDKRFSLKENTFVKLVLSVE